MRSFRKPFANAVVLLAISSSSSVIADQGQITAGLGVSVTQGVGIDIGYELADNIQLRGSYYSFTHNDSESIDNIDFDVDLSLKNAGVFMDFHPWSVNDAGFRLSGGVLYNGNRLKASGQPDNGSYNIGGTNYSAAQVGDLNANVGFRKIVPYLGVGYDVAASRNVQLSADLGVVYQKSATVDYSATGALAASPTFQADLAQEEQQARDDLNRFEYLPVMRVAVSYRF